MGKEKRYVRIEESRKWFHGRSKSRVREGTAANMLCRGSRSSEACLRARTGDNRICDPGGSSGSDRHPGHNDISPEARGAVGSNIERHKQLVDDIRGQSSVEFAIVLGAIMCIVVALGALASAIYDGMFVEHAVMAASHNVEGSVGGTIDVFCY